jgi:hypothetical protein
MTEWQPQPMIDLLQFCQDNDESPPDFIEQMIAEGKCAPSVRQFPSSMDSETKDLLKEKRHAYYKINTVERLVAATPFKHV